MAELRLENSIIDDRYYIARCLGSGSYAEIFLAYDQHHDDLPVIIKALNTSLQGTPDVELEHTLIENFQNEALALDRVRHPHIIRRLGHGSAADLIGKLFHYLVLEYMAGGDLQSVCSRRPCNLSETLFHFEQVAEALAYAHSQQVIHRDIKPKNLLLSANYQIVKIADFGVAKMTHQEDDVEITRVGTNVYAPPEHHPDSDSETTRERLTPSADIYSLAKTIYTAMTGRAPRQFARKPITQLPPELATQVWGAALLQVLRKATASRVAERYATIHEFWEDFVKLNNLVVEDEAEKTLVRKRLSGTSDVAQPMTQPNFQAIVATTVNRRIPQQARIVVELPTRERTPVSERREEENSSAQPISYAPATNGQAIQPPANQVLQNRLVSPNAVAETGAPRLPRTLVHHADDKNIFDHLRSIIRSDWLRRAFIVFFIAAMIGIVASVYFHFAGQRNGNQNVNSPVDKEGVIGSAGFVNLRAEPNSGSTALRWLPKGTRVRALEQREGWIRVRVIFVPTVELPPNAPRDRLDADTGWISTNLIQF
ncbi:MAG: protein kinase [Acidobacteria bacterium]|nr:protein kinase [Acidobacteriota bacterium]